MLRNPGRRCAGRCIAGCLRAIVAGALLIAQWTASASNAGPETPWRLGQNIYLHGLTTSGQPLRGERRDGAPPVSGATAACVNCHQHSGLGSHEGSVTIPPIAGDYLFRDQAGTSVDDALPYVETMRGNRPPYDEATLARAIREGIDSQGRTLGTLMPRFALTPPELQALTAYLRSLSTRRVPGVTDTVLHFATIVTPDADPLKRQGMLDVLRTYFDEKNTFPFRPSPHMHASGRTGYSKDMYRANRRWQLHVWSLTGPPAGWRAQLERLQATEPVYAVISGLAGAHWQPVHDFCEQAQLPCLFPNVEVPADAADDFYSLYFSRGVLLEADVLARAILGTIGPDTTGSGTSGEGTRSADAQAAERTLPVTQFYRAGDCGEAGARALGALLRRQGREVRDVSLPVGAPNVAVARALAEASGSHALVLWLRPKDLAALPTLATPSSTAATVYYSGLMGGLEDAPLPSSWRTRSVMSYPFDLPDRRGVRLDYPLGWFALRHIPVVAEQVQADTYLACSLLVEALNHMADAVERSYLIETLQGLVEHRVITGYYPHLTLANRQHYASKGGYLAHFAAPEGNRLVANSEWLVP